jgi:PAS domain S-box-containing protein
MKALIDADLGAVRKAETLRLELVNCQRELRECRARLTQMDGLFSHVADAVFVVQCDGRIIDANPAASTLLGYSKDELLTMHPWDYVTSDSREEILANIDRLKDGVASTVLRVCRSKSGEEKIVSWSLRRNIFSGRDLIIATGRDVTRERRDSANLEKALKEVKRSETLLTGENKILEMVAAGKPLRLILESLCLLVENCCMDSMASVLLVDSEDCLRAIGGAGPRFPKDFLSLVDGVKIGPKVGSCGTAAHRKKLVVVEDIATDPLWRNYSKLAIQHGLLSGWSSPILSSHGDVLGVFGIYWDKPRSPSPDHLSLIDQITHLASIAINRERDVEALRASEKLARGQAESLTQALDALATETNPEKIVEHVLRTVIAQLNAHSDSVWLKDSATELMVFQFGVDGRFKTKFEPEVAVITPSLPINALAPWREVFRTGKPSFMDVKESPEFPWRAALLERGIVACLWIPMLIDSKVEGVLGVRFKNKRTFQPEELRLAQSLANQAMLAIQLARLSGQSRQTAVIEERNRMARDIHDTLAHGFTGVIMQLEAAEEAISRNRAEVVSTHLQSAGEIARDGLREARRSVQALRPLALEGKTLTEAMEDLAKKLTSGTVVQAKFSSQGVPHDLPSSWEANILRIEQEVLTNVLRHAQASELNILLVFDVEEIRLSLRDDGCGFDPTGKHEGFGLKGIAERVEHMGGRLFVQSANGAGTTISVVLPVTTATKPGNKS